MYYIIMNTDKLILGHKCNPYVCKYQRILESIHSTGTTGHHESRKDHSIAEESWLPYILQIMNFFIDFVRELQS